MARSQAMCLNTDETDCSLQWHSREPLCRQEWLIDLVVAHRAIGWCHPPKVHEYLKILGYSDWPPGHKMCPGPDTVKSDQTVQNQKTHYFYCVNFYLQKCYITIQYTKTRGSSR